MSVQNRYTDALAGNHWLGCLHNLAVLDLSPETKRLLLALLLLTADVRDDVAFHLRPVFERLASSGDCLIRRSYYLIWLKFLPCSQNRCIALDGTVRFYCYEASLGSQTFFLELNHLKVLRIDLRHYHRNIRCPAVCAVVGNNRCFCLCIRIFNRTDLFFCHIYGTEHEINFGCYLLDLVYVHNGHLLHTLRHRGLHFPASADCLLICFSCRTRACCQRSNLIPRMICQKRDETLTYHTSCSQNAYT